MIKITVLTLSCFVFSSEGYLTSTPSFHTTISAATNNSSVSAGTDAPPMPHHLYIGRCNSEDTLYYQQNFILNNSDERMQASTNIFIKMDGPLKISCVKVIDQMAPGAGAYLDYKSGGVGEKFVSFDVTSTSGKGFNLYVQIFGRSIK